MTIYTTGTVSVTNGSAVVTGSGTAWAVGLVTGGMFSSAGVSIPIASVTDDTHLTLAYAWPGSTASGAAYAIQRDNSDAADIVNLNDRLSQILVKLSLVGIHPDNSGTLAKRNALTLGSSNDNYLFLRAELGVEFAFYRWDGPTLAWIGPFSLQGTPGVGVGGFGLPVGGSTGQFLRKASGTDGDAGWSLVALASGVSGNLPIANGGTNAASVDAARASLVVSTYVATRTALKALDTTKDVVAYLKESGREGAFVWTAGDFSAQITADTLEGIYVKANAIAATSGAWVRKFYGPEDLRWYGLVAGAGNAAVNTLALAAAIRSNADVRIPVAGTFEFNGPLTFTSISSFTLEGIGPACVLKCLTNTNGLVFASCQAYKIGNFAYTVNTAVAVSAGANGIVFNGTSSGVGNVHDIKVFSVPGNGLRFDYPSGSPASGAGVIKNNTILSCGVSGAAATGAAGFYAAYMNDTHVENNQFGNLGLVGPRAVIGAQLAHCKAGNYTDNYHWENDIGCQMDDCDYSRIIGNRFETNQKQGLYMLNTDQFVFTGNTLHTNSMAGTGLYDHAVFDTCTKGIISSNNTFEWTGGVTLTAFALNFNAACAEINVDGNSLYGYTTVPVFNLGTSINYTNNLPRQTGLDRPYNQNVTANGSATINSTVYMGPSGGAATQIVGVPVAEKCNAYRLYVQSNGAPGAGQSYTVTLRKSGVDTALVATITGAGVFSNTVTGDIDFAQNDSIDFKVVASTTAPTTDIRISLGLSG